METHDSLGSCPTGQAGQGGQAHECHLLVALPARLESGSRPEPEEEDQVTVPQHSRTVSLSIGNMSVLLACTVHQCSYSSKAIHDKSARREEFLQGACYNVPPQNRQLHLDCLDQTMEIAGFL